MRILPKLQQESVRDYACRVITDNIVTLELKPGSIVSETELAQKLGVSRTPVREAIIQLGKNGMVETYPQRGTKVSLIDSTGVDESRFFRIVIEKALVREIALNHKRMDMFSLSENIHRQEFCLANHNYDGINEADGQFHRLLFKIAGKERNFEILNEIFSQFDRVRYLSSANFDMKVIVSEHKSIYEAMKIGDAEEAEKLIDVHLSRYKEDIPQLKSKYPDYFLK